MEENSLYDKKSLREITGKSVDWDEVAKDCVAFSNAQGGVIDYGIEDDADAPPADQKVSENIAVILEKRISGKTQNVSAHAEIRTHENGGQYIRLHIARGTSSASTTSGKYFTRVSDESRPLTGDDITRLSAEKGYYRWEDEESKWSWKDADKEKLKMLLQNLRNSNRVSDFVKQKDDKELLDYYFLTVEESDRMTNLGVLFIGTQSQRGRLMNAPVVQCIQFDQYGDKVWKYLIDDFTKNPQEIIEAIWNNVPVWRESNEISDGLFRKEIPAYDETVVRELTCNALVHRPYTVRGDIFINIHPDRIEVVNPGALPLGVTPQNILHKTVKRNEHFANLCYALQMMEREGSGYDKMYEVLLSNGKQIPIVEEGDDYVKAIVGRRIISQEAIKVIRYALQVTELRQKQIICLGLIAQHESLSAADLIKLLNLKNRNELSPWLNRLVDESIVETSGRNRGKEYRVCSNILKESGYKGQTSLKRIEPYRIRELIIEDLKIYECTSLRDIQQRIGDEISYQKLWKQLDNMIKEGILESTGKNRWTKYRLKK
ncbi:ATP-binding protein [Bacteroides fragilis]|uniref:ATP-binding protein n=1 Tax=Bacteroides fragilis TaxID=817 RepID=UPI00236570EF|nr:ATP-binding protein [Bacteroides fragilis]